MEPRGSKGGRGATEGEGTQARGAERGEEEIEVKARKKNKLVLYFINSS